MEEPWCSPSQRRVTLICYGFDAPPLGPSTPGSARPRTPDSPAACTASATSTPLLPAGVTAALATEPGTTLRYCRWAALLVNALHRLEELWTTRPADDDPGRVPDSVGGRGVGRVSFRRADKADAVALDAPPGGMPAVVGRVAFDASGIPPTFWRVTVPVERT